MHLEMFFFAFFYCLDERNGKMSGEHDISKFLYIWDSLTFISYILLESNSSLWKTLLTLRDHNSERRALNPDLWDKHEVRVAHFVVNICKMAPNEDIVFKIMGILATNSAHLDLNEGYGQGCGLYATFAKVNHRSVV